MNPHNESPVRQLEAKVRELLQANRQLEQRLADREREEKPLALFRALIDQSNDTIDVVEAETGRFLDVNETGLKALGYTRDEFLSLKVGDIDHTIGLFSWAGAMEELRKTGSRSLESVHTRKDGTTFPVEVSLRLVRLDREYVVAVVRNIAEHKQTAEALRANEAQLSNALQMARAGQWEYDVARDLFTFNDNFYRIFRTTVAEVGGYQMSSADYARRFCHPDDLALIACEIRAAIESSDPNYGHQIEHRIVYADGEVGHITVRFGVIKDAQGRTVKTYGVNQDITERKRTEEALREAEARYRLLFEQSPDGVVIIDPATAQILVFNEAAHRQLGYSRDEFIGLSICDIEAEETPKETQARIAKAAAADRTDFETRQRTRLGEIRNVSVTAQFAEFMGRPVYHCVWRDITEKKRAEAKMKEQLGELSRWHALTLGRETRVIELKREVNELLAQAGRPPRYDSVEPGAENPGAGN